MASRVGGGVKPLHITPPATSGGSGRPTTATGGSPVRPVNSPLTVTFGVVTGVPHGFFTVSDTSWIPGRRKTTDGFWAVVQANPPKFHSQEAAFSDPSVNRT